MSLSVEKRALSQVVRLVVVGASKKPAAWNDFISRMNH